MKLYKIEQGSPEWHELRGKYFTASNAPAVMGESKYKTRSQLLEESFTGKRIKAGAPQHILDRGHESEAAAREILEMESLEDFPAVVMTETVDGIPLLASLDGYSEESLTIFEHKLLNQTLLENVEAGELEPTYYWQLEHQLLVAGDAATAVLFIVSDGSANNRSSMYYHSVPERRERLIAGWKQFKKDLEAYAPKAKPEPVIVQEADGFPLVSFSVSGSMVNSNIQSLIPIIEARAQQEMAAPLESDADFAEKDGLNKKVKAARKELKETVDQVKDKFVSFSEFSQAADQIDSILQKLQAHGEKAVKEAKIRKKAEIINASRTQLADYIDAQNAEIEPLEITQIMGGIFPSYESVTKNKRNLESIQNAVDDELSRAKIEIDQMMELVAPNRVYYQMAGADYAFLFRDLAQIIGQAPEAFKAVVDVRISTYEEERAVAEKIRQEQEITKTEAVELAEVIKPLVENKKEASFLSEFQAWAQAHNISHEACQALLTLIEKYEVAA